MKRTIVLVDDHVLITKALESIISTFNDFELIYSCQNGKELIERLENGNTIPDIILLDISMPVMNGFETALWLKQHFPQIKVMALSMQNDEESVINMTKNGARGYLLKDVDSAELELALTKISENGFYYPTWASKIVFDKIITNHQQEEFIKLTDREKEFLQYVATEMSYKEIAEKMCCSPRTVESYRDQLCEKLHLKTRVGLAVFAIKNNFYSI